ncbi:kinetochore scaffold 1 isoform X2 [Labrus bergylta]|uniref:kinetochore scaffold 1 isoform X2 n=1 Tax=Labrus bergylta TaxID=56723 RepID=UPI003313F9CB
MEPSDPEGSSGFSKRRISSILKAPRKSIRLPDPEQQKNVVECAKPVEKRNSRRVSFAPANDVLLFSKDVKNVSPARSPLQDLMTTAAADTQNRVQYVVTEDGIQQITGMDTLLNAPLHTRQRDTVNFDAGLGFGEKTVLFSTDDALMDMTHSHTINIARDEDLLADISLQNYHILPTGGEKTVISVNGGSMDMTVNHPVNMPSGSATLPTSRNVDTRAEKKNTSSAVPSVDPEFENFLANLSKPSRPIVNPAITRTAPPAGASSGQSNISLSRINTQQSDVDKENQVPSSVSAVMEKTLNMPSVLYPEDDVSMDMTGAQTGRIQAFTDDDDDPFQCLFPSQEMYSHLDNRASQTTVKSKQQQSRKTLPSSNSTDMTSLRNSSLRASLPGQRVNLDSKDEHREKTIVFTAGDDFMDMTQSQTVNIASGSFPPQNKNVVVLQTGRKVDHSLSLKERKTDGSSTNGVDVGLKSFLASLSKPSGASANPVNARMVPPTAAASKSFGETFRGDAIRGMEVQTSPIMGPVDSDDPFQFLLPTKDMQPNSDSLHSAKMTSGRKNSKVQGSFNHAGMGTSLEPSLKTKGQRNQVRVDFEDDGGEKTVRFTADDAAMDVTRSHTVNIANDVIQQPHQHVDYSPACGEKTVRFTANEAAMDETRSHTVNIAASLELHKRVDSLPNCGEKTLRFTANDAAMDETRSHTVNIAASLEPHKRVDSLPNCGEKTLRFTANDAAMDETRSHTVNIAASLEPHKRVDSLPNCGEKTLRFTANDAAMDETRSHTVNIAANLQPEQQQKADFLPTCGEKTLRFTADDAAMDVTRSHTVNIAANLEPYLQQKVDLLRSSGKMTLRLPANEAAMNVRRSHTVNFATNSEPELQQKVDILPSDEKTLRFSAYDAAMDVTKCLTVNISTNVEPQLQQKVGFLPTSGENTLRFETDATMDVTQCHTANIATSFETQSHQYVDVLPNFGEKTLTFAADDAAMDVTQCITGNIASISLPHPVLLNKESNIVSTQENKDFKSNEIEPCQQRRKSSLTTHTLDQGFKKSLSKTRGSSAYTDITKVASQETETPDGFPHQCKTQKNDVGTEIVAFNSVTIEKQVNETMREEDGNMDMTEAQTGNILRQTCTDESPPGFSSTQDFNPDSDHFRKTEMTFQTNDAPGSSNADSVNITNRPTPLDSNESDTWKEDEPRNQTCSLSEKIESSPAAIDHDVDAAPSRKSRRRSIADLQSKLRRLSHLINTNPDAVTMESSTAPLPLPEHSLEQSPKDKTKSLEVMESELECDLINADENTQAQRLLQEQPSSAATPFNLKTKQLMSRLSVGGFKAKLPQRTKPDESKKVNSVEEHTRTMTVNVTNQLSNFDADVSDINDEELGSCEDMSEMIDTRTPQKVTEKGSFSQKSNMEEPLEDDVFEQDSISPVCGNKRPLPVDENNAEEYEKRMKASTETLADVEESHVDVAAESDGNMTTAPSMTTQHTDFSNSSHTASRCEATFESTFKHSMFESQLEDYANDVQRKFDDGSITVLEFFKLFNIDFVIHNPRQSVLPGRLLTDTDRTPIDLLKDRHINRPKQSVYETNVLELTGKVEELKGRMRDLDKPLRIVNEALWEAMRNVSEKELKSFGAKLKERNNLFRKTSKAKSHEMKEVLYSQLVQANLEEQQKLRGRIEKADEMIQSLDDCIHELETEMSAVEEKGTEDTPSLRSIQEELQVVTDTMADKDRLISELEMQNTQNSSKLNRLIAETRNLESHVDALKTLNEWKFGERRDDYTVFTFLHDTFHLELLYDKSNEDEAQNQSERKISHIVFNLHLDDEKSHDHARLVHKLLSGYIEGETSWVEKYPTSKHVPKLLHDVSHVVSHCRLLGEELRLLKMWGGLRLDILDISCVDTQVHIVFSSLKKFSKFEVIFSVSLSNQLCVLGVQSFKNLIGSTTIEQIEEIVASFSPTRKLLTKIVKKIHENLLC